MKILLVDDEIQLTSALKVILAKNNYSVDCANDGETGLDMALTGIYDVIVLDVMMPKLSGFEVVKELRKNKTSTPIIMLSAKGESTDKIEGLNLGADDYLSKPFNTNELIARINALTRRKAEFTGDNLTFGDLTLDRSSLKLSCNNHSIVLGKKEFQILEMLILNKNRILDKEKFIEKIWGFDTEAEYNAIEVYISFLRKKLVAIGSNTEIKSVRGIGYILGYKND